MGGGLMQLVAYGAQDVYLTGNPQITFFKVVYRRHTNFAVEAIEQTFNGSPALGAKSTVQITRNGDLVTKMYLKATLTATSASGTGDEVVTVNTKDGQVSMIINTAATGDNFALLTTVSSINNLGVSGVWSTLQFAPQDAEQIAQIKEGDIIQGQTNTAYYTVKRVMVGNASTATGTAATSDLSETSQVSSDNVDSIVNVEVWHKGVTGTQDSLTNGALNVYRGVQDYNASSWVENVGHALIDYVELQIGGTKIDKHYGHWMTTWSELTRTSAMDKAWNTNVGNEPTGGRSNRAVRNLFVPLQFFCCRNDGLALPLIALQYHDVRLDFNFNGLTSLYHSLNSGATAITAALSNVTLLTNYIYLDSEERKKFAQNSHEYLIEQVQFNSSETLTTSGTKKVRLNFNHPCKELVWVTKESSAKHAESSDLLTTVLLKLNGHDRFDAQPSQYFNCVQPAEHHTRAPRDGVHVYSFALNPEEHQPSGTCNFSRIDNAQLDLTCGATGGTTNIYAVNYNVLRIMSGMGGLAYSN